MPSVTAEGRFSGHPEHRRTVQWALAVEVAVGMRYNGEDYAVVMATPQDLDDLALGFSLSEEIIGRREDIRALGIEEQAAGWILDMQVRPAALARQVLRKRRFAARSGCGICGVQSLEEAVRISGPVERRFALEPQAILSAFAQMPDHQPINRCNRSVHGAAWCRPDGQILVVREDVGRHNALDKLIGALARNRQTFADGFVALTSRCSFEMVQKAAAVGIPALASLSAPTALALQLARQANLQIAARSGDGVVLFDPPDDNH